MGYAAALGQLWRGQGGPDVTVSSSCSQEATALISEQRVVRMPYSVVAGLKNYLSNSYDNNDEVSRVNTRILTAGVSDDSQSGLR